MKRVMALCLVLVFTLTACLGAATEAMPSISVGQAASAPAEEPAAIVYQEADQNQVEGVAVTRSTVTVDYDSDDLESDTAGSEVYQMELAGTTIVAEGGGVEVDGNQVTITSAGTYSINGVLTDGQIIVDTEDQGAVVLRLEGADITNTTGAPIYVLSADKTVITLVDGTENTVTDGRSYVVEDAESDEPNAAIFSKDDLTINGSGSLIVNANYNHGIDSKDDLKIMGGTLVVNAVNDGIKGRDSIAVKDGNITINAGGDGLQANNAEDPEEGYIVVDGGTLAVTAGLDGIQAETQLVVNGGTVTIVAGGGSANAPEHTDAGNFRGAPTTVSSDDTVESAKGLKAGVDVVITGGTLTVDSADDAVHADSTLTIEDGNLVLQSGDDGLRSGDSLTINGGDVNILGSYEGIESTLIILNDGTVHVVSSDDGINAVGGDDSVALGGGMVDPDAALYINGGYLSVDAAGDGLDSNGSAFVSGGVTIVNGPTFQGNGALDCNGTFDVTGGFLVAAGSLGMAEAPSDSSTQLSVMLNYASVQAAGTTVHLETEDGEDILTFVPAKEYQSVVVSSPELESGTTYVVYSGGSSTGTVVDGWVSGGSYTAGTELASLTTESVVTTWGTAGFSSGGGRRHP